jgi:hypothetical protein
MLAPVIAKSSQAPISPGESAGCVAICQPAGGAADALPSADATSIASANDLIGY